MRRWRETPSDLLRVTQWYVVRVEFLEQVELLVQVSVADLLQKWLQFFPSVSLSVTRQMPSQAWPRSAEAASQLWIVSNNNGYCSKPLGFGVVCLWQYVTSRWRCNERSLTEQRRQEQDNPPCLILQFPAFGNSGQFRGWEYVLENGIPEKSAQSHCGLVLPQCQMILRHLCHHTVKLKWCWKSSNPELTRYANRG